MEFTYKKVTQFSKYELLIRNNSKDMGSLWVRSYKDHHGYWVMNDLKRGFLRALRSMS